MSTTVILYAEKLRRSYSAEEVQPKRRQPAPQLAAATNGRNFRTFLLMQQFEAQEIAARIKQARLERGLTQEALAEMASFSKRSLQDYEGGNTIPYHHFRELGRLLNKPPEWFLYGEEVLGSLDEQRLREIVREEIEAALAQVSANGCRYTP